MKASREPRVRAAVAPRILTAMVLAAGAAGDALAAAEGDTTAAAPDPGALPSLPPFVREADRGGYVPAEDSLLPTARPVEGVFGGALPLLETPRAVTVLTPAAMDRFGVDSFRDLERTGAGTEPYNFYGIAGSPHLRGWEAGTYYNGMLRAYQRNSVPVTLAGIASVDLVKGPAPAHFLPTGVGGYAQLHPAAPPADPAAWRALAAGGEGGWRDTFQAEAGSYGYRRAQLDTWAPVRLPGGAPAAYRAVFTAQEDDTYYDGVRDDYLSVTATLRARPADGITVFAGGSATAYSGNENVGWNRPTQALIDDGRYVVGEGLSLARTSLGGRADRGLIDYLANGNFFSDARGVPSPFSDAQETAFRALVVPADVAVARIPAAGRALMRDLSDATVRDELYAGLPADIIPATSGFLYTPAYFAAGGRVVTAELGGDDVLVGDGDYANAENFNAFFDLESTRHPDRTWRNKIYIEYLETARRSSYGYAFRGEQFVFADRFEIEEEIDLLPAVETRLHYGAEFRYTHALHLEDFWSEPFPRRDLSAGAISGGSILLSGDQVDPNTGASFFGGGTNRFGGRGTNNESDLFQYGLFSLLDLRLSERLSTYIGLRGDVARFRTEVPSEVDLTFYGGSPGGERGQKNTFSAALNPVYRLTSNVSLYAAVQAGTSFTPSFGGSVRGEESFAEAELYEAGVKTSFLDGRLYSTLAAFYWDQGAFDARTNTREQFRAKGVEFEVAYEPSPRFALLGAVTARRVFRRRPLTFRAADFSGLPGAGGDAEQGIALNGATFVSPPFGDDGVPDNNPDLEVPGAPEVTAKLYAVATLPNGFGVSAGPVWRDGHWHNYDQTLRIPSSLVWNASVFYRTGRFELTVAAENLTDEEFFYGADPDFGSNTLITPAPGRVAKVVGRWRF